MTHDNENVACWVTEVSETELRRIVDALHRAHQLVSVMNDLDALLERLAEESKRVAQAEASSILLYDETTAELSFRIALGEHGNQQALKHEVRLALGEGIAGAAAANRESIIVQDATNDKRVYRPADVASQFKTRSLLAVPLMDKERLVGVLEVVNKQNGGEFTTADLHVTEIFSSLAAAILANARLIEANLKAERLAAVGQAIAGLSHHTKNIVAGMEGSTQLLDEGLEQENWAIIRTSWPILKRATQRIRNFVGDMLAYSKPRKPVRQPCDLRKIVGEVEESFRELLARRSIDLNISFAEDLGTYSLDGDGLYRCLLNLLLNAAEALPGYGGQITLSTRQSNGSLVIEVSDNGPGIPEEALPQLFEPFFSTKANKGTGLGLAVTRKIIEEHGGRITVHNAETGGACFTICLPTQLDN